MNPAVDPITDGANDETYVLRMLNEVVLPELIEKVARLEAQVGTVQAAVEPWIGVDGQARFRLERIEQGFQALVQNLHKGVETAQEHALQVLQIVQQHRG